MTYTKILIKTFLVCLSIKFHMPSFSGLLVTVIKHKALNGISVTPTSEFDTAVTLVLTRVGN